MTGLFSRGHVPAFHSLLVAAFVMLSGRASMIPDGTMSSFAPCVTSATRDCGQMNDILFRMVVSLSRWMPPVWPRLLETDKSRISGLGPGRRPEKWTEYCWRKPVTVLASAGRFSVDG